MTELRPHIDVRDLAVSRGTFGLSVQRWQVLPGQVVGVVGPNGSGKTTLLETLAGIRERDAGAISMLGVDPQRDPAKVRTSVGFMASDMPLFVASVHDLLRIVSGYYIGWDPDLVDTLLDRFNLDSRQNTNKLSRGEATRLRLILALAFRPRVLLLDEPSAGLDLGGRRALLDTVLDIVRHPGRTVIISSHQLADVERVADRLLVLNRGSVLQEGPTDQLVGPDRTLEEALIRWGAAG